MVPWASPTLAKIHFWNYVISSCSNRYTEEVCQRQVEGTRLALLTLLDLNLLKKATLKRCFQLFANFDTFIPSMAPFVCRNQGSEWFRREFLALALEHQIKSNEVWKLFLTPMVRSTWLAKRYGLGLIVYLPNLIARQFGLSEFRPTSIYKCLNDLNLGSYDISEKQHSSRFSQFEENVP